MRLQIALLIIVATLASPSLADQHTMTGTATVIDGDTIEVAGTSIRLHGIDAPEVGQRCSTTTGRTWQCGVAAMNRLAELVEAKQVTCTGQVYDAFDRLIAVCRVNSVSVNEALVSEGLAWAFVQYSDAYVSLENEAKATRTGIWQASTIPAWVYRAERWKVEKQKSPDGCPIKGNISSNGKIYHTPWSPWYSRTRVSVENGERWFCSEREALDAGWRAPRWR